MPYISTPLNFQNTKNEINGWNMGKILCHDHSRYRGTTTAEIKIRTQ